MQGLLPPFGTFLLLLHLSFSDRSLFLTLGILGAVLLLGSGLSGLSWRQIVRASVSPYLPVALVAAIIAPWQSEIHEVFFLLSIPAIYALARVLRFLVPARQLALGIGFLGFVLGALFVLGQSLLGEVLPPIDDLSTQLHKNVFGWAVAFGLVMAPFVFAAHQSRLRTRVLLGALFGGTAILLFFTRSMTGFLGAGITLLVLAFVSVLSPHLKFLESMREWRTWAPLAAGGLMVGFFVGANVLEDSSPGEQSLAGRDSSLTGRTGIWSCFLEGLIQGRRDVDALKQDCIGDIHYNLHNSFLEGYTIGGGLLAFALLLGFVLAILQALRGAWSSSNAASRNDALFALAIAILGLLTAFVESYIFDPRHWYPSFLVFLGPMIIHGKSQWSNPLSGWSRYRGLKTVRAGKQ